MATPEQTEQPSQGRADHRARAGPHRKRVIALVVIALAFIWLVAFILSNSETVRVDFVFGHVSISLIWVMIICAALGALLALGIQRFTHHR